MSLQRKFKHFLKLFCLIPVFFLLEGISLQATPAFKAKAVSSKPGPKMQVLLTWEAAPGVRGYNIYRKTSPLGPYPTVPLNTKAIVPYRDCNRIKALIPPGSDDWQILAKTFADTASGLFNPCNISQITTTDPRYRRLQVLTRARWKIAAVAGVAYSDKGVVNGTTYYYRITGAGRGGTVLASDIKVVAGSPTPPPTPTAVQTRAGDSQVLIFWAEMPDVAGFNIYRSTSPSGTFLKVNQMPAISRFRFDPDGNPLTPDSSYFNGFLDYARWDTSSGLPTTHIVDGHTISGPLNGITYYYKVSAVDILNNEGSQSSPAEMAKPVDKTPPRTPLDISITAVEPTSSLEIRWSKVTLDVKGHVEIPHVSGYRVYRYENAGDPLTGATAVGGLIPHPTLSGVTEVTFTDSDPNLRSAFGEKTWWYRVEAVDAQNNVSARSAAASGFLKDITPPDPPVGIAGEGFEDYIKVTWKLNTEKDMDSYNIYRSLCDFGQWKPCEKQGPATVYLPPQPCSGPFLLLGNVSQADAKAMEESGGTPYFEDRTVPAGSPVCYAYLVKALDKSQNMSGSWPIPDTTKEKIICERLRDRTPPEPAFISKLLARDNSVLVDWIGAPVQDIKAYHVYRSEKETGPFKWVGGMTVEPPPNPGIPLSVPYQPAPGSTVGCGTVPLFLHDGMSVGSFVDKTAVQHQEYWYKVVGIDQSGNESPLDSAVVVSTFTFSTDQPAAPLITSITKVDSPCALKIQWNPPFDPAKTTGFMVFRNFSGSGVFHQLSSLLKTNQYTDSTVVVNKKYWYRVISLDTNGTPSPLSPAKEGVVAP